VPEPRLLEPVNLCTPAGELEPAAVGWSTRPLHRCNLSGRWLRKKRWNYWCITSPTHVFSATLADLDYAGLASIYFVDLARRESAEETVITPFGRGCAMPDCVDAGLGFEHRRLTLQMKRCAGGVHLLALCPRFGDGILRAEFHIRYPADHETLNVVIPWSKRSFQFTAKHNCLPTEGSLQMGDSRVDFLGEEVFACLDFGRGIWPRATTWNWGSCSTRTKGRTLGLNLGGQWTDGTGMTENALCVDGRLTKIGEDLRWEYDRRDFSRPWRIATPESGRVDLHFQPRYERASRVHLGLVRSEGHQLFGHYSGTVVCEDGGRVALERAFGWAEEHVALW
jgi:hypothetical protein